MNTTPAAIECLEYFAKNFQGKNIKLPNISIIGHNKLIEIEKQFKEKNLDIYDSYISMSVIMDLLNYIFRGNFELDNANFSNVEFVRRCKRNKNIFSRIVDKIFKQSSDIELNKANTHLEEYMRICTELENYNLRNNFISSIMLWIQDELTDEVDVEITMKLYCFDVLEGLGLSDLIPQLKEELKKVGKLELLGESSDNLSKEQCFRRQLSQETNTTNETSKHPEKTEGYSTNPGLGHGDEAERFD